MASPGMLQNGLSRELFEAWCTNPKNGVIIAGMDFKTNRLFESLGQHFSNSILSAGYCVEGTPAKMILSDPEEITTMTGQKLPLKMSVDYVSFSAHADYQQTSEFIRILRPPQVVSHLEHFSPRRFSANTSEILIVIRSVGFGAW